VDACSAGKGFVAIDPRNVSRIATFTFRCPARGLMVQGWIADDPIDDNVICTAYARTHWVNPKTGKVLGAD